ncbi:MAG: DMT family transporter [Bacteriovorax sp.]|nr:DMT family transporter [Rhizobacter sp.]
MKPCDALELVALAAVWGSSFIFMRLGAGEFGALPLSCLRVAGAAIVLLPLLAWRREWADLRAHWKPILLVGITNSAFPFACFAYAALTISAGLSAIFNAAAPLFGAVVAWLWWHDRLSAARVAGLLIGFAGVFGLAVGRASVEPGVDATGTGLAVLACIAGSLSYGFSANFTKRHLTGVKPLAVAAGSQLAAALVLAVPAWWAWPTVAPEKAAWLTVAVLAIACTGIAYVMYFRLIAHIGPANAITVTFLVPAFALAWGALFLGERPTAAMLAGCAVILAGTSLATGLLPLRRRMRVT